ncbi:MAG: GHMP kinase [Candidatus Heimdallarchaeota archaeon]|nr:MAG: GHMP kinase [Candidatus Heimdallarchaeota archaeon]
MTDEVSYWVASHLTGIFEIRDSSSDILKKGSRGAGLSINRGVITTIGLSKHSGVQIFFDGREKIKTEAVVTSKVIEILLPKKEEVNLKVEHNFQVPLSSGYGASAAGAVGTAFALNDLLELGLSELELLKVAHQAEVITRSGLGDVIGLYQGGLEIRLKEGAPGIGKTMSFTNSGGWKVATVHLGKLPTSEVLSDNRKRETVNEAGRELISELISRPTFSNFVKLSAAFSAKTNLWSKRLQNHVRNLPHSVVGSQIMLGEAFFIFYHDSDDLKEIKVFGTQIHQETICQDTIVKREER